MPPARLSKREAECGPRCRSQKDAARLIGAACASVDESAALAFLSLSGTCSTPGKVADCDGRTLLHVAAALGYWTVIRWLSETKEAPLNVKDRESGYAALHRAAFHGRLRVAAGLLAAGANPALCDNEGLTYVDHLVRDCPATLDLCPRNPCEAHCWGANANYNLGSVASSAQHQPDQPLETFRREGIFLRAAALNKFHSAFLSTDGRVFTCGHGRGGRLGHGNEESQLGPRSVATFAGQSCDQVALGMDHSLFLLSNGSVWACGTNVHNQLGIASTQKMTSIPTQVTPGTKGIKFPPAIGISASRFHSLFWTSDALYTWGLNAGQLGHLKGERTIVNPKLVSALNEKHLSIKLVASSEAAIVVLTKAGELLTLHEYSIKKVPSRHVDVAKVEVVGGYLDCSGLDVDLKMASTGHRSLKIFVLTNLGHVLVWEQSRGSHQLVRCLFTLNRELLVRDISVNKSSVLLVSKEGLCYEGTHQRRSPTASSSPSNIKPPPTSTSNDATSLSMVLAKKSIDLIKVRRVPNVFRGTFVASDPKGENFCVLQLLPNASLVEFPEVDAPSMSKDMRTFYETATEFDSLHDVVFKVGSQSFYAHKFIVACASDLMSKMMVGDCEIQLDDDMQPELFEQILQYAYTKSCDMLKPGKCTLELKNLQNVSGGANNNNDIHDHDETFGSQSAYAIYKKRKSRNKARTKNHTGKIGSDPPTNALEALKLAATKYNFFGLLKSIEQFKFENGSILLREGKQVPRAQPCFSRKSFPELQDVIIRSSDGVDLPAHKPILAARLDYFRSMFSFGWAENDRECLSLPMASDVISAVLDYIYREEASTVANSEDIEFVSTVLATADQLLAPRLVHLCERQLVQMLTLRNVAELLQFAYDFHAAQLKASAMQFVCQNAAALLEAQALSSLSDDCFQELSDYYRQNVRGLSQRHFKSSGGPSATEVSDFANENPCTIEEILELEKESCKINTPVKKGGKRCSPGSSFSRRRNISSSSLSSVTSDSGSESAQDGNLDPSLSLEELEIEEREDCTNLVKQNTPCSDDPEAVLADFFGSPRKAVEKKDPSVFSKKFSKKSQKERKKLLSEGENDGVQVSPKEKWKGWGSQQCHDVLMRDTADTATPSLAEIMRSQSKETNKTSPTPPAAKQKASKSSWKQLDLSVSTSSSSPVSNPWKRVAAPSDQEVFKGILSDQVKHRESVEKARTKRLSTTQKEEQAIEELKEFYNVDGIFDELITVVRAEDVTADATWAAAPIWKRHTNRL